jgi:MFS family permease
VHTVQASLRRQAHPNFIRWTICNGNRPRVIFARGLGVGGILGGLVAATIMTISSAPRAWRVLAAILLLVGIATLVAAWKGMCVVSDSRRATPEPPFPISASSATLHSLSPPADPPIP